MSAAVSCSMSKSPVYEENRVVISKDTRSHGYSCEALLGLPQRIVAGCSNAWYLRDPSNFLQFTADHLIDHDSPNTYKGLIKGPCCVIPSRVVFRMPSLLVLVTL